MGDSEVRSSSPRGVHEPLVAPEFEASPTWARRAAPAELVVCSVHGPHPEIRKTVAVHHLKLAVTIPAVPTLRCLFAELEQGPHRCSFAEEDARQIRHETRRARS